MFPGLPPAQYLRLLFRTTADIIQWREKDLEVGQNRPFVRLGVRLSRETGKLFAVNSQIELALEEQAPAIHLTSTQSVIAARRAQAVIGRVGLILGKSVHSFEAAVEAEDQGADYVLLSPVLQPISKGFAGCPLGFQELGRVCSALQIPVFALGGIKLSHTAEVSGSGAMGLAGISWLHLEVERLIVHSSTSTSGEEV